MSPHQCRKGGDVLQLFDGRRAEQRIHQRFFSSIGLSLFIDVWKKNDQLNAMCVFFPRLLNREADKFLVDFPWRLMYGTWKSIMIHCINHTKPVSPEIWRENSSWKGLGLQLILICSQTTTECHLGNTMRIKNDHLVNKPGYWKLPIYIDYVLINKIINNGDFPYPCYVCLADSRWDLHCLEILSSRSTRDTARFSKSKPRGSPTSGSAFPWLPEMRDFVW